MVDKFLWFGMRETINTFRADTLGLDPIRLGEHGGTSLFTQSPKHIYLQSILKICLLLIGRLQATC